VREHAWKRAGRIGLVLLVCVVGGAAGVEGALRAARFEHRPERIVLLGPLADRTLRSGTGLLHADADELWTLRPGAPIPGAAGERVNSRGYRGPELALAKTPGRLRVAVLGGDAAFGSCLPWEETFCAQLVLLLEQAGAPAEVLCAGVPKSSIRQRLEHYRRLVRPHRPDVLVHTFVGDIGYHQAPGGLSDDAKLNLLRARPDVLDGAGGLCLQQLAVWLRDVASGAYWRDRFAHLEELRLAGTQGALDWPGVRRVPLGDLAPIFDAMFTDSTADGGRTLVLSLPPIPEVREAAHFAYVKAMEDWATGRGVAMVRGRSVYLAAVQRGEIQVQELALPQGHPSARAHALIARALADEILKQPTASAR
jgi:hypothetical protein